MRYQLGNRVISVCLLSSIAWGVFAKEPPEVQGESTQINIIAAVVDAPCSIDLASRQQSIEMQPIGRSTLRKVGSRSAIVWFNIKLHNCIAERAEMADKTALIKSWSAFGPIMAMIFYGPKSIYDPQLFAVTGSAKGIGLRLFDAKEVPISPDIASAAQFLIPGNNVLTYGVAVERTVEKFQEGNYRSVINFMVNYD